ncbi:hypothetical protein CQA66_08285 [Helicobacter aurati]|uniref:Uncharacterized protein n=1 Tax=Helicobacter aurati TaxID=137778 RepID=A0A3D8IZH3_9HELI|nr:hypothetical protein [Helicobacter aurati]RDU70396.1 hypothetical protein CQA66_08285 [Helicobacter aurati]
MLVDFTNANKRLKKWRNERHIDMLKQRESLLPNILEEITEYLRATNNHDKINALCDMSIFILNAYEIEKVFIKSFDDFPFNCINFIYMGRLKSIVSLEFLLGFIASEFKVIKYDYLPCLYETIKEIESRIGHWDNNINKWVKETQYEKIYTPNYEDYKI